MGCVYLATHAELTNRRYAIKVLFGEMAADRTIASRFRREAEIASTMSHENVVPVIDIGITSAGVTYLVMEYVEGRTLDQAISNDGAFSVERAVHVARGIASGLMHAHGLGFVHRDLKPANVMLARREDHEVPKLLDFGIAATVTGDSGSMKLTQTGHTVGTPLYMAPEQFRSPKVGPEADLYALGAILYEMISGRPPFAGAMMDVAYAKIANQVSAPPPEAGGLGALSLRLMRAEPVERIQSAKQVRDYLDQIAARRSGTAAISIPPPPLVVAAPAHASSPLMEATGGATDASLESGTLKPSAFGARKVAFIAGAAGLMFAAWFAFVILGGGSDEAEIVAMPIAVHAAVAPAAPAAVPAPTPAAPPAPPPAPAPASDSASASAPQPPAPVPDAPIAPVVSVPPPSAAPAPKAALPRASKPAPVPETTEVQSGRLNVVVMRAGQMVAGKIVIDGKENGTSPLSLELPVGPHLVKVVLQDGTTQMRTVDVSAAAPARAVFNLE
jgi:serine/threonine-protein kinase